MNAMLNFVALATLFVLATGTSALEEHPWAANFARNLQERPEIAAQYFAEIGSPKLGKQLSKQLKQLANPYLDIDLCTTCQAAVPLIKLAVRQVDDYNAVRNATIAACIQVVSANDDDIDAELLCPGTMDLYGQTVIDIIKDNRANANSVCYNLNLCFTETTHKKKLNKPQASEFMKSKITDHVLAARVLDRNDWRHKRDTTRSGDVIRIAHLADIHIDPEYATGAPTDCGLPACCRASDPGTGSAAEYATWGCNIPQRTVEAFMAKVAEMDPDFVIYTGDNPPHHMWGHETQESQLICTQLVVESFNKELSNYTVYPVMGNHEPYPTNIFSLELNNTKEMISKFNEWWPTLADFGEEQLTNLAEGLYYGIETPVEGLKIITVNSNYWYSFNFYNILNDGSTPVSDMETYLVDQLEAAKTAGQKVIIAIHHPPGNDDVITKYSQWYQSIVAQYADIIVLQVCGHTHHDHFKMFMDENDEEAVGVMYVSPSVTGRASVGGINPSMRIYELDGATFELLNYHQYHMPLGEHTANASVYNEMSVMPEIEYIYNAKDEYGLPDMSPASMLAFLDAMEADDSLFDLWLHNRETNATRDFYGNCDQECKMVEYLCWNRYSSFEQVAACEEKYKVMPTTASPTEEEMTTPDSSSSRLSISHILILALSILVMRDNIRD